MKTRCRWAEVQQLSLDVNIREPILRLQPALLYLLQTFPRIHYSGYNYTDKENTQTAKAVTVALL